MRMEGGAGVGGCLGMGHGGEAQIKGTHTHGGRYVQYNIYGNLFEVSAKYVPPIRPVGRGACGIIWYVLLLHQNFASAQAHDRFTYFISKNIHFVCLTQKQILVVKQALFQSIYLHGSQSHNDHQKS
jgi:hypothetical protein